VFRDFSSASHGSESLQKKKFPGCGALKNGASQSFFCLDRFKIALNLQNLPCTVEITRL
jgi:hypothetical protein